MPEATTKKMLPSLSSLFKESWEMFKGSVLHLFVLNIISFVIFAVLFVVALIIALPLGAFSIINAIQSNAFNPAFFASLGGVGIVILLFIIAAAIVGFMIQAATIIIVAGYKKEQSYSAVLKQGLGMVLPLFLASIVVGFIVAGGYFLFLIPGILFFILLAFTTYEIVLEKKGVIAALKGSVGIVSANFWGILARMILWFVIVMLFSFIPQIFFSAKDNPSAIIAFSFVTFVLNILVSWFGIAYSITLYNQAKSASSGKTGRLMWLVIVAVVGWIAGLVILGSIVTLVSNMVQSGAFNNVTDAKTKMETLQKLQDPALRDALENPTEENMYMLLDLLPTDSPERAQAQKEIEQYFKSQNGNGMMMDEDDSMMDNGTMMPTGTTNSY